MNLQMNEFGYETWHLKIAAFHQKNLVMDQQDHTQDKIIIKYKSRIKAKQAHDHNHFKVTILY